MYTKSSTSEKDTAIRLPHIGFLIFQLFSFTSQTLSANKSMFRVPILLVPYCKHICKHNVFCNLRMHIFAVGTNLMKSFNLTTEQLVYNSNIFAVE